VSHLEIMLKRFEMPDEVRRFAKGRLDLVRIGGLTIGRATYEPGWRWSEHVGPSTGATRCTVEHVGRVLEGTATAAFEDGRVIELQAGELFHIPALPHDSWVVGEGPTTMPASPPRIGIGTQDCSQAAGGRTGRERWS
jgi:quercetin dioxygenase-like cupin family protein